MKHNDVEMVVCVHVPDEMIWEPRRCVTLREGDSKIAWKIIEPFHNSGVQVDEGWV
jgi:hypothetical protein